MRKTILITGANGQLGKSLQEIAPSYQTDYQFVYTDIDTLDITSESAIANCFEQTKPDFVINAAAYTAVDKAESDIEKAYLLNEAAVRNLAIACAKRDLFFVHISTDYVFDGKADQPYDTDCEPNPVSVYGKSKWAGEIAIHQSGTRAAIVRTAWLYSPYGRNFVKTMLHLADTHDKIRVVDDQHGCPTLARDLAQFILAIISQNSVIQNVETFHFANRGQITWYDFSCEILRQAGKKCEVEPISSNEYPTPASRPNFSVFDLSKATDTFHFDIPEWKESLQKVLPQIIFNYENNIV